MWTSTDPDDQFWNSYSYCGGDPVNLTDPDGQGIESVLITMAVFGTIGGLAGGSFYGGLDDNPNSSWSWKGFWIGFGAGAAIGGGYAIGAGALSGEAVAGQAVAASGAGQAVAASGAGQAAQTFGQAAAQAAPLLAQGPLLMFDMPWMMYTKPPIVPPEVITPKPEVVTPKPEIGTKGTRVNPDGTPKNSLDQLKQMDKAQQKAPKQGPRKIDPNKAKKSLQNNDNDLKQFRNMRPKDAMDWWNEV